MALTDYSYYSNTYKGRMSEDDFNRLVGRAEAYIGTITFRRIFGPLTGNTAIAVKDAECSVADAMLQEERGGVVASASNDGYSETYAVSKSTVERRFYNAALPYLALTGLLYCGGMPLC